MLVHCGVSWRLFEIEEEGDFCVLGENANDIVAVLVGKGEVEEGGEVFDSYGLGCSHGLVFGDIICMGEEGCSWSVVLGF